MQPTLHELEAIYRSEYRRFLRVAEAVTGDFELARDAVNEGFARAIRSRQAYRGAGSVESWVWACVVNTARSTRRAEHRTAPVPAREAGDPCAAAATPDDGVRALVAALPERQRLVLYLRYYADLDYRDIARALGVEVGTVGATLHKAHGALRHALEGVRS